MTALPLADSRPKSRSPSQLPQVIAVLVAVVALSACGDGDKAASMKAADAPKSAASGAEHDEKGGLKLSPEEVKRSGIQIETLAVRPLEDSVTVTATIRPNQDRVAKVSPRVEGRIVSVKANLGDFVHAGDVLATLDSLAVGEASSELLQARSEARLADAAYLRASALNADEIISQRDFLRAKADQEKAQAALRSSEDRLRLLGVNSKGAGDHVQSVFPLTAPLQGVVIEKSATIGGLANTTDAMFVVADLSKVWIEADLTEAMLAHVNKGALATVTVNAYPNERFQGHVTFVASALNKDSRTVGARIEVDNKDGRLKPEMFASASIASANPSGHAAGQSALTVPDNAIVLMQGQPTVFVFAHGGYEGRAVELSEKTAGRTIVKAGLESGEQVVTSGAFALKARVLKSQISEE
jgi:cobalt-zinc-cadmium efflux system membrane fusion protein